MISLLLSLTASVPNSDVTFSEGRDYVYVNEFKNNNSIVNVIIPEGFKKISTGAFQNCTNLAFIQFPESLEELDENVFQYNNKLISLSFVGNFKYLHYQSITECLNLQSISFPKNFDNFASGALRNLPSLQRIIVEEGNTKYTVDNENGLFMNFAKTIVYFSTTQAVNVILPETVKYVDMFCFEYSKSIKSLKTGSNCEYIHKILPHSTIETIEIGKSVKTITSEAFSMCDKLTNITISPENKYFTIYNNNCIMNKEETILIFYPDRSREATFVLPPKLLLFSGSTLANAPYLTSFILNQNMVDKSFVIFNDGVLYKKLGTISDAGSPLELFMCPPGKTSISINPLTVSIGICAFDGSRITGDKFNIPSSVKTIKAGAFRSCRFKSIDISHVIKLDESAFHMCQFNSIVLSEELKEIPAYCFRGSSLTSIKIPHSVEVIDIGAFSFISKLETVDFGAVSGTKLTVINSSAFESCTNMKDFDFPISLLYIEKYAFKNCQQITRLVFPVNVVSVGEEAFSSIDSLKVVNVTNCFTKVHKTAFKYCRNENNFVYCQATDVFTTGKHFSFMGINYHRFLFLLNFIIDA